MTREQDLAHTIAACLSGALTCRITTTPDQDADDLLDLAQTRLGLEASLTEDENGDVLVTITGAENPIRITQSTPNQI